MELVKDIIATTFTAVCTWVIVNASLRIVIGILMLITLPFLKCESAIASIKETKAGCESNISAAALVLGAMSAVWYIIHF